MHVCVFCLHILTLHKVRLSNIVASSFIASQELSIRSVCVHSVMVSNHPWLGEFQQWILRKLMRAKKQIEMLVKVL